MQFIDTHTHLYDTAFEADIDTVISDALTAGVSHMLLPGIDSSTHDAMLALAERFSDVCRPMAGLHPTSVNENPDFRKELDIVAAMLQENPEKFCGIGETGLDLYWSKDFLKEQNEALEFQMELAIKYNLPIVLHVRDAFPEIRKIMEQYRNTPLRGVFHSFAGTPDDYHALRDGEKFVFGIGGVVTYKKSQVADTVAEMELSDIVLETDSPYLPPVPYRGKRNQSGYISLVARKIAEIKGVTEEQIARITTANTLRMFKITSARPIL